MNSTGYFAVLVLLKALTGAAAQSVDEWWCPTDWWEYGSYCYQFESLLRTWDSAEARCQRLYPSNSPHLASIHSDGEMIKIASMMHGSGVNGYSWFGLRRYGGLNSNADGTTQTYDYWADGYPALQDSCVGFYPSANAETSGWMDGNCNVGAAYICKMYKLPPLPACPDGGEEWGDGCYSFHLSNTTKQDAEEMCKDENKNLVSIESEEENLYVSQSIFEEAWLGLAKNTETGEWVWSDSGANYENYDNWAEGYPTENSECAVIDPQSQEWTNPSDCSSHRSTVVCKGARGGATIVTAGTFVIVAALFLLQIFQM